MRDAALSAEQLEKMWQLRQSGISIRDLAKRYSVSPGTIWNLLQERAALQASAKDTDGRKGPHRPDR